MSSKHTPGPWEITAHGSIEAKDRQIALVSRGGLTDMPNARLIAAAPELLEALQVAELALRERGLRACGEYKQIEAAIAKATGGAQ
jgi:hypothetical protein